MEKKYPAIAGKEKGPGPGRYGLPPTIGFVGHDFTKPTSPAYSFHGRMSNNMLSLDSSPGPLYHVDAKITRFGKDGTPAYSMLSRMKTQIEELFSTPGPGTYRPEKAPPSNLQRRPPSYTMGRRTRYRTVDPVPAPNKYSLPPLLGSHIPNKRASASYTMSGTFSTGGPSEDLAKTPGPCRYNSTDPSVYRPRQPAFSMLGRHDVPKDKTKKPGPGTYNPENVTAHKTRAPAYSMGVRHSEFVTPLVVGFSD
ncbi:outer dense fiber protein 3-like protein 2b isoform X1 [Poecilia latipinna]|uniref:outer dense fiber protein 3-like protein 2 isoform X1 n=1 Tax=Poecilia mexicana TaxID=48701 RepID=UPI00072E9341|nr:PREDICTED: outer dense fiber protein 3-like protein 2 isoform X1 [Poecilia mexicana]XP_014843478.1 PREDICTED: outer dense fiber protein 3-like protein 2 isoform X1 [Poecilia mexicana]XP_014888636.1 PREDICTED: outer dense fiber protein 3-like protein 2 isoform X1 [Poecilia latipinna]XP_016530107.1 PREDICTED: outer dense fiber protein 3-like protein 2 isoform X1 [Poecilia formosa]